MTGTKRFDSEKAGDREVQRTMLELLNQMDGFQPNAMIKVSNSAGLSKCPSFYVLPSLGLLRSVGVPPRTGLKKG